MVIDNGRKNYSKIAIISFILGIVSFVYLFIEEYILSSLGVLMVIVWFVLFALAIIFVILGLIKIKKNKGLKGKAFAWLGLIIIFLEILFVIRMFFALGSY